MLKFKEIRDQVGVLCQKCGSKAFFSIKASNTGHDQHFAVATSCKQASARVLVYCHASDDPHKKRFSSLELQRQQGYKLNESVW